MLPPHNQRNKNSLPQKVDIQARLRQYHTAPGIWVNDIFGKNIALSNQQANFYNELGKLIKAKLALAYNLPMTDEDKEYSKKIGISIMSGKGSGKDFTAALTIAFFLNVFFNSFVTATANTAKQLRNVLWREISKIMGMAKKTDDSNPHSLTILQHLMEWQAEKIAMKAGKGEGWFAEAVTVNPYASTDEQAKALTGRHEKFMLIVVDEAMGIPEAAFSQLDSTLTGQVNLILMIFNPFKTKGYAIDSHGKDKHKWVALRWNCEETIFPDDAMTRALQARNEYLLDKYGRDSSPYRIQVLGLPPHVATDTLIPWEWITDAINRVLPTTEIDPIVMGIDPAAGGDKSVIVTRHGGKVIKISRFTLPDTVAFTHRVKEEIKNLNPDAVMIDCIGIGKGVFDELNKSFKTIVYPVDVRKSPLRRPDRYDKLRDELAWIVRGEFEKGLISIPDDDELIGQISIIKSGEPTASGKETVASKKLARKELGGDSPDEWDALLMTYAFDDDGFRNKKINPNKTSRTYNERNDNTNAWMGI